MKNLHKNTVPISGKLLRIIINKCDHDSLIGDFDEMYDIYSSKYGRRNASLWYRKQIINVLFLFLKNSLYWGGSMFKNYLKTAFRNIKRSKLYNLINVSGLAIGLVSIAVISLYVKSEIGYDNFHKNFDRIYRVEKIVNYPGRAEEKHSITSGQMAGAFVEDYPEVVNAVKIFHWNRQLIQNEDKQFYVRDVLSADENFFEVFSFKLLKGDPKTVLKEPYTAVINKEQAEAIFPDEDPMGKNLNIESEIYKITGIIENPPKNSHIKYSIICSWATTISENMDWLNNWRTQCMYTYLLLAGNSDYKGLESKLPAFMEKYMFNRTNVYSLYLKSLKKIHLYSSQNLYDDLNWKKGNIDYIYLFPVIALFILVIGCINFMNLSTARSSKRAREVSMRKVIGAYRSTLIKQFISESVLLAFISMFTALILINLILPIFNSLSGRDISFSPGNDLSIIIFLVLTTFFVGIISGSYPAFVISSFQPASVFKGSVKTDFISTFLRKGLVIFQFVISIVLIVGTMVVYNQMNYVKNRNLGFNKERIVIINNNLRTQVDRYESLKNDLLAYPEILNVTGSRHVMGGDYNTYQVFPEGRPKDENWIVACIPVDYNYISFMEMEIIEGRNFSKEHGTDAVSAIIINETLAKKLNWENPLNKRIDNPLERFGMKERDLYEGRVIGIVKDFHIKSLHHKIEPVILLIQPERMQKISIRISPQNMQRTLNYIEKLWKKFDPSRPFEYTFLDQNFNDFYKSEMNLSRIFNYFSFLAIFIACMGLFGLASFTAEQKTREIGIRKVFGASVTGVLVLLSSQFIRLVLIANLIALPVSYYLMNKWLQNFAFHSNIHIAVFLVSALLSVFIALFTISYHAVKAATSNPIKSLRCE